MNSSRSGEKPSGFSNSSEPGSSMEFKTPHFGRSRSVVSRPRFVKVKKSFSSLNNRSLVGANPNPFAPVSENFSPASFDSGLGGSGSAPSELGRVGNERFVFGGDNGGNLEKGVIGEMRNLRVGGGNESGKGKLGGSLFGSGRSFGVDERRLLSRFPDEARKMRVGGNEKNSFVFGSGNGNGSVSDGSNVGSFVFGSGKMGSDGSVKSSASMNVNNFAVENNVKLNEKDKFCFGGSKTSPAYLGGGKIDNVLSNELGRKMKIGKEMESDAGFSSSKVFGESVPTDFCFQGGVPANQPNADPKPAGAGFEPTRNRSLPKNDGFGFTSKNEGTPSSKENTFPGVNQKLHINTMREAGKRRKGKLKQSASLQPRRGQETQEARGPFSPMDISPYQETAHDSWHSRGTSVASDESLSLERTVSNSSTAPQRMNSGEEGFDCYSDRDIGPDDSISMVDTESFKSAVEEGDYNSDIAVTPAEFETNCIERRDSIGRRPLGFPPMADSNFTFATPSTAQAQSTTSRRHHQRKKKNGPDAPKLAPKAKVPYMPPSTSAAKFFPSAESSLISSHTRRGHKGDLSAFQHNIGNNSEVSSNESNLASTSTMAAQEACEKWRLRGNQAYANGDLLKAEDCYTQGVNCIPKSETSRSCLRALMLCYSNRAATHMSLGRMRTAIEDCVAAASIDPNFLKVQVRAANCYLALGELEDASRYYTVCLQSGSDCVDRKMAVEASDGLQKAQKVSECIHHCAELLGKKTSKEAESIVELTTEALSISSFSEKLLEMKAEALFMLGRYEEVVQLCEGSFDSAEKNDPLLDSDDGCSHNVEASETSEDSSFRIWRCRIIFNAYFHLGRLEEAVAALEKHDEKRSLSKRKEHKTMESSTPLAATVRELLRHKAGGNEAFQAGRHTEAVEHYTAALSCNVESRTFAAICFCSRAAAYNSMGQITDAISDCSLAIALDGNYMKAISKRAALFEMIRDYGQAASDMRRLVALLTKQVQGKSNQPERSASLTNDLNQAHQRLSEIEEKVKKAIPLDMYLILGVEPSVTVADIKKAYRKAALRHHPDKASQALPKSDNGDEIGKEVHKDADKLFIMIGEAYAVLSDATKRSWYDAEEEVRITMKKRNGNNAPKSHTNNENHQFERSASARQWREVWRSPTNTATYRKSETFRASKY